jgi:hypothetical protein
LRYIILCVFLLNLTLLFSYSESYATSPSFPLQGIHDINDEPFMLHPNASNNGEITTWQNETLQFPIEENLTNCNLIGYIPPSYFSTYRDFRDYSYYAIQGHLPYSPYNIEHVTYTSDGNKVNGTIYLTPSINNPKHDSVLASLEWIDFLIIDLRPDTNLTINALVDKVKNAAILPYNMSISGSNITTLDNKYQIGNLTYKKPREIPGIDTSYQSILTIANHKGYVITYQGNNSSRMTNQNIEYFLDFLISSDYHDPSHFKDQNLMLSNLVSFQPQNLKNNTAVDPIIRAFPTNRTYELGLYAKLPSQGTDTNNYFPGLYWETLSFWMTTSYESAYNAHESIENVIVWNNTSSNWDDIIRRQPSSFPSKFVTEEHTSHNHTNFSKPGSNYVNFQTNLSLLNYPDRYNILFYINSYFLNPFGRVCALSDVSDTALVPPPEFNITASPSSFKMIPGDVKNVRFLVKSNTQENFTISFTPISRLSGIEAKFTPSRVAVPSTGEGSSDLSLIASENVPIGTQTLPIDIHMVFNYKAFVMSRNGSVTNPSSTIITKRIPITINVMQPEFNITSIPSSLEMRPGDKKNVEIQLNSGTNLYSNSTFVATNGTDIHSSFVPKATNVPRLGIVSSTLQVNVDPDAKVRPNSLPYSVTFTTIDPTHNSLSHSLTRNLTLSVTVLPPLTLEEYLEMAAKSFTSLNSIWVFIAAIGAVVSSLITRIYTQKKGGKNNRNTKMDDYGE